MRVCLYLPPPSRYPPEEKPKNPSWGPPSTFQNKKWRNPPKADFLIKLIKKLCNLIMARCLSIEPSNIAHWIENLFYDSEIPINHGKKKNPNATLILFLQYYLCFGNLLHDIFSNYGKNGATLLKPQLSSYAGSDFIIHYFIIVK